MSDTKTIIIGGNFRGGTTAVTAVLEKAGLFIGDRLGEINKEDLDFQEQLHGKTNINTTALKAIINDRNRYFETWGFKYPAVWQHRTIFDLFRNPFIILVFRDPVAVAISENKRTGQSFDSMLRQSVYTNTGMIAFTTSMPYPVLPISFERLLTRTEETIKEILDFTGLPGEPREVAEVVDLSKGYNVRV